MTTQKEITRAYNHHIRISESGLVAISISARCKSRRELDSKKDEDLRVEIDGLQFREIPPRKKVQLFNIPASWNGSRLKGLKKTIVFLIFLNEGKHTISLMPRDSAFIEDIEIEELGDRQDLEFDIEEQAEDGDRRPWYAFVLVNLPLREIGAETTIQYRWWDSDDVKIIIDNKIQRQPKAKLHRFWFFAGILIKKLIKKLLRKRATLKHTFGVDSPKAIHYIEFWADKTPILHEVELSLGEIETPVKGQKAKVVWEYVNLRKEPSQNAELIVKEIKKGENVIVLEKAVRGKRPIWGEKKDKPALSDRWHRVFYRNKEGYIYSEALEIEGEDRNITVHFTKDKCKELNEDVALILAVIEKESNFFPYAVGLLSPERDYRLAGKGIMQINDSTVKEIRNNKEINYNIKDVFNIKQNVEGGIRYFKYLRSSFRKSDPEYLEKVLISWNCGPNCIDVEDRNKPIDYSKFKNPENIKKFIRDIQVFYNKNKRNKKNQGKVSLKFLTVGIIGILIFGLFLLFQFPSFLKFEHQNSQNFSRVIQLNSDEDKEIFYKLTDDLDNDENLEEIDFRFYRDEEFYRTEMKFNGQVIMDSAVAEPDGYTIDIDRDGVKEVVVEVATGVNNLFTQIFKFENQELKLISGKEIGIPQGGFLARGGVKFIDYDDDGDLEMRVNYYPYVYDPCKNSADIYEYINGQFIKTEEIKTFEPSCREDMEKFRKDV